MRNAYLRLHSTMKRIVEKELLDGAVCRFQSQIITGKVKNLVGISQYECDEVMRITQKCHSITDAHAPSNVQIPLSVELCQDILSARNLIKKIRARKNIRNNNA